MTEPSTTAYNPGVVNSTAMQEYRLAAEVTLRDVDQEVGLTLAGLVCDFDRCEGGHGVTYLVRWDSSELGRLVIAPPTRVFPYVRVREVQLCPEFEALCQPVRRDLEVLSWTAEQAGVEASSRFSYPRPTRRQIVEEYRTACSNGEVENKESWAQRHYHICRKTLWRYECEFPEEKALPPASNSQGARDSLTTA
jgi:hypothetical protein